MYRFSLQKNKDYAKFKERNCEELLHKYRGLFIDIYESKKYALSPSKLLKKSFDDDIVSERIGRLDKMPVKTEMRDEHMPSSEPFSTFRIECSDIHSGEKRENDSRVDKGKKKVDFHATLSESVQKLASVGNALATHLKSRSGPPSFEKCMQELEELEIFDGDENYECWAIVFFREGQNV
ncbi:Uncharacterized protein Adt_33159 [Abeliophyllum distichum]|uniref:Uncharacterized protein n=1 Tax=Abeliophyllum distichum TaxID=126358 RepID=A0ABD1QVL8_9LAMI